MSGAFRIRTVYDDTGTANREAVLQVQAILRTQFVGLSEADIGRLPEQLRNPLKQRLRAVLFVAETGQGRVKGFALLLHAPDLRFCYLEYLSAAPGTTGTGVGGALYERVREETHALGASGLFFECLPDDPALSPDPQRRAQNAARLRFYERYGARPVANTAYETPLSAGDSDPPYLVYDPLGDDRPLPQAAARVIVRAILQRKYAGLCPPDYVERVVDSFRDDPVCLRAYRYPPAPTRARPTAAARYRAVGEQETRHPSRPRAWLCRSAG